MASRNPALVRRAGSCVNDKALGPRNALAQLACSRPFAHERRDAHVESVVHLFVKKDKRRSGFSSDTG